MDQRVTSNLPEDFMNTPEYQIKTFVFFDLETSGLDESTYEEVDARMLELSMVAISRKHFCQISDMADSLSDIEECTPRILHKYTRLYNPKQNLVTVADGLNCRLSLIHLGQFSTYDVNAIGLFLRLPFPVCLIAHYGNGCDFTIFKAELVNIGFDMMFPELKCADSLEFMREFLGWDYKSKVCSDLIPKEDSKIKNEIPSLYYPEDINNSTTPTNAHNNSYDFDDEQKRNEISKVKRVLPFSTIFPSPSKKRTPFNLQEIYRILFGKEYKEHRAETDAIALMKVCACYGEQFTKWADNHYTLFKDIKPKWYQL